MALKATGTKNLECDLFPWSDGTKVKTSAPMKSPWRTIIVGGTPSDVVMSTLTLNLNEPNKLSNTSWIEPGKYIGVWWEMIGTNQSTWGSGPHHGATTEKVINENQDKVKEYKSGKEKLFGFFVGQAMKVSGGKANPQLVNEILKNKLK